MSAGSLKNEQPINNDVSALANQVKSEVESKSGKTYSHWAPVSFAEQTVAGKNYFIKVDVGNNEAVHLRVYKDLKGNVSLHSHQGGKSLSDAIHYF